MEEGILKKGDIVRFKVSGYPALDIFKKEYLVEDVVIIRHENRKIENIKLEGYLLGLIHPTHLELVTSSPKFKKGDTVRFTETAKKILGTDDDEHIVDSCDTIEVVRWNKGNDCSNVDFVECNVNWLELVKSAEEKEIPIEKNCSTCAFFENEGELFKKEENGSSGMYTLECTNFSYPLQNCVLKNFEGYQKKQ